MKLRITYQTAAELERVLNTPLRSMLSEGATMRVVDKGGTYKHAYITTAEKVKHKKRAAPPP